MVDQARTLPVSFADQTLQTSPKPKQMEIPIGSRITI